MSSCLEDAINTNQSTDWKKIEWGIFYLQFRNLRGEIQMKKLIQMKEFWLHSGLGIEEHMIS